MERDETIRVYKNSDNVTISCTDDMTGSCNAINLSHMAYNALERHFKTGAVEICTDEIKASHIQNVGISVCPVCGHEYTDTHDIYWHNKNIHGK